MVRHSMTALSCTDVMRYTGQRVRLDGLVPENLNGEVVMDMKKHEEGRVEFMDFGAAERVAWRAVMGVFPIIPLVGTFGA